MKVDLAPPYRSGRAMWDTAAARVVCRGLGRRGESFGYRVLESSRCRSEKFCRLVVVGKKPEDETTVLLCVGVSSWTMMYGLLVGLCWLVNIHIWSHLISWKESRVKQACHIGVGWSAPF